MVKIECTKCSQVIHASDDTVPDGVQPGEWFEMRCPRCEDSYYMELAKDDSQAVSK